MLGNTTFSKICNSIVLVLLLGYAAIKVLPMIGIEPAIEVVSKETVYIDSSDFLNHQSLQAKLASFNVDNNQLSEALSSQGVNLETFVGEVQMEFVLPSDLQSEKSITIEFVTSSPKSNFIPGFKNVAKQVSSYLNGKSS